MHEGILLSTKGSNTVRVCTRHVRYIPVEWPVATSELRSLRRPSRVAVSSFFVWILLSGYFKLDTIIILKALAWMEMVCYQSFSTTYNLFFALYFFFNYAQAILARMAAFKTVYIIQYLFNYVI